MGYVPALDVQQYAALCAELALQPVPRGETLRRYRVPTEAAFRALEEHWRQAARRGEVEGALAGFAALLRGRVLR